jgi:hypothetical protein
MAYRRTGITGTKCTMTLIYRLGYIHSLVRRQHLALRAGAAEAQSVSHHTAGISVPTGQQPERGGHQLQFPAGNAGHETAEGIGKSLVAAQLTWKGRFSQALCDGAKKRGRTSACRATEGALDGEPGADRHFIARKGLIAPVNERTRIRWETSEPCPPEEPVKHVGGHGIARFDFHRVEMIRFLDQ